MYRCVSVCGFVHVCERMQSPEKSAGSPGPGAIGSVSCLTWALGWNPGLNTWLRLLNACSLPLKKSISKHFLTAFSLLSPFLSGRARVLLGGHLREEPHCFTSVPWLSFLSPQSSQRARNMAAASVTGTACSCPRRLLKAGNCIPHLC